MFTRCAAIIEGATSINARLPKEADVSCDQKTRDLLTRAVARIHSDSPLDVPVPPPVLDELDRRLIEATQAGLALCERPYEALARQLASTEQEIIQRLCRMQEQEVIRRIAAVPNHYALGFRANGMSVWDVEDDALARLGPAVGALDFVSHCYHRPRHPPAWPYNLFAMVHGRNRAQVEAKRERIAELLGESLRGHDILYSTRILKKTGLRINKNTSDESGAAK